MHLHRLLASRQSITAELATDACRKALSYYCEVRAGWVVPPRSAIDPVALKPILPNVIMLEWKDRETLTVRLAGTDFHQRLGGEITGANWLALQPPEQRADWLDRLTPLCETPCGAHFRTAEGWWSAPRVEYLLLPLCASPDQAPRLLFGAADVLANEAALSAAPQNWGGPSKLRYIDLA